MTPSVVAFISGSYVHCVFDLKFRRLVHVSNLQCGNFRAAILKLIHMVHAARAPRARAALALNMYLGTKFSYYGA